jgi:hypothetical protein
VYHQHGERARTEQASGLGQETRSPVPSPIVLTPYALHASLSQSPVSKDTSRLGPFRRALAASDAHVRARPAPNKFNYVAPRRKGWSLAECESHPSPPACLSFRAVYKEDLRRALSLAIRSSCRLHRVSPRRWSTFLQTYTTLRSSCSN